VVTIVPTTSRPTVKAKRDAQRTREAILKAALGQFSSKGFGGARVDEIAARSGTNKRMIYHYFGSKEGLYLAALERTYSELRSAEQELDLASTDPQEAMRRLTRMSFRYFQDHPHFISMLNTENLHKAQVLKKSPQIRQMHSPLIELIADILKRGQAAGVMRGDVDPIQLYISIAALGYFYFSNSATLSTIFGRDLLAADAVEDREGHVVEMVMAFLDPARAAVETA
jgi:AcrR family transcriptional regulator